MNIDSSAAMILDRAAVQDKKNVFVLGCYAKRVTFHSQQNRALNLVWALFQKGKINADSKIAVIGAGLAGITASIGAKSKGCSVDLYEASDDIMHIQRGNWTRYIHPNIYDWPQAGCDRASTDLPFLNWSANVTDNVISQIESEWEELKADINFKTRHRVSSISEADGLPRVSVVDPFTDEAYDCVIVAAGFGKEKTMDFIKPRSYWSSDDLHQAINSEKTPQEFLVSGCGDGGLIDALRLSIKNFRHDAFTKEFLEEEYLKDLSDRLIEIESKISTIQTDVSRYIFDEYKKLSIPAELLKKLKRRVRTDTKVLLIGTSSTPFITNSSLLNRFAIFLLQQIGKISYMPARLVGAESNRANYTVTLDSGEKRVQLSFDQVVLRHGPEPVVNNLVVNNFRNYDLDNETARGLWESGFYPAKQQPALTRFQIAEEHMNSLLQRVKRFKELTDIGVAIGGTKENPLFIVTYNGKIEADKNSLSEWNEFPVLWHEAPTFKTNMSNLKKTNNFKTKFTGKLVVGSPIRNRTSKGGIGTLGCFVSLPNGRTGIMSTNHVLLGKLGTNTKLVTKQINRTKRITIVDENTQTDYEIARLYRAIPLVFFDGGERSLRPYSNISDAAVAILNSDIAFSPSFRILDKEVNITEVADPLPGISVYKIGATSGLTKGTIVAVYGTYTTINKDKKLIFKDAILVKSSDGTSFSLEGDSGALVFDENYVAYGIVMACSKDLTLVCPIKPILEALECRLY